jgi:penicillin-binding protein 1A
VTREPRDDLPYGGRRRRQAERRRRRHTPAARSGRLLAALGGFLLLLCGGLLVAAAILFGDLPDLSKAAGVRLGQNSSVFSGSYRLSVIPADENRTPVRWKDLGAHLRNATIAIEDRRYWQHGALDYEGIGRALWKDVTTGTYAEGGSTITQQLVRNLYIPDSARDKTVQRKVDEAWLAIQAEDRWTKAQILTMYLNTVFYGRNAYGAEAAAETYFNRHAKQLTLAQAALLAGLPQAPSDYDPFKNPVLAKERRNEVLLAMRQQHMISVATYQRALRAPLGLEAGRLYSTVRQPYFVNYVKQVLMQKLPGGAEQLLKGGLSIETTINRRLQFAARRAIVKTLKTPGDPAAVIVSIQPRTGAIVAMQSSTNFASLNFNLATQGARQAGSTFKAIALTAAVDDGIDPDTTYYTSTPSWDCGPPLCATPWHVETYEHTGEGTVSLTNATLASDNVVYAKLSTDLGSAREVQMAHLLGITSKLKDVPSIALGSLEVTPLELTSVYATLAAGGVYRAPRAVRRVRDSEGEKVGSFAQAPHRRAVPDGVASIVTGVLEKNIAEGTGVEAQLADRRPEAGKTGTTSDYADAWFCGYTPDLATCVWVGYPKDRTPLDNIEGVGVVTGGTIPAQIWHDYMTTALQNVPPSEFPAPLHPADVHAYRPVRSSGPGSSTPYSAPPPSELANPSTTATTTTPAGTAPATGAGTDTTAGATTDTTTTGN